MPESVCELVFVFMLMCRQLLYTPQFKVRLSTVAHLFTNCESDQVDAVRRVSNTSTTKSTFQYFRSTNTINTLSLENDFLFKEAGLSPECDSPETDFLFKRIDLYQNRHES